MRSTWWNVAFYCELNHSIVTGSASFRNYNFITTFTSCKSPLMLMLGESIRRRQRWSFCFNAFIMICICDLHHPQHYGVACKTLLLLLRKSTSLPEYKDNHDSKFVFIISSIKACKACKTLLEASIRLPEMSHNWNVSSAQGKGLGGKGWWGWIGK